jgi:hypothetical protein
MLRRWSHLIIALLLLVQLPTVAASSQRYTVRPQGNDSNCDFNTAANGIQNIGGDGEATYWRTRQLVVQAPLDYREGFYTLAGANGSDRPYSLDNLGTAPEAFVGVYEQLGYDSVLLASVPHQTDHTFTRALRDQLATAPERSFAHIWVTYLPYNAQARTITVANTGERVDLLYPYHEVAIMADTSDSDRVVVLDGLVGYPYSITLDRLAQQLRGFNQAVLVRRSEGNEATHIAAQIAGLQQPYATIRLGGAFLRAARALWGASYQQWGQVISPPLRMWNGQETVVRQAGDFVLYEWGSQGVHLAALGVWARDAIAALGVLPPDTAAAPLQNAMHEWAVKHFGSVEHFHSIYGPPISSEFWVSAQVLRETVLHGVQPDMIPDAGALVVLTERSALIWTPELGTQMVPLGAAYYQFLRKAHGIG